MAFVIGTLVALPALKLTVEYLILLTLAVSSVIIGLLIAFPRARRHLRAHQPARRRTCSAGTLQDPRDWVLPSLVAMLLVYCDLPSASASRRTAACSKGIREDPIATQALGKNVFGYKVAVFGITSALAALRRRRCSSAGCSWRRRACSGSRSR